jgi:uncharacterized membrane protein HdeD (DUF308 family)
MKKWTRWQDWVAVAAGLYAVLSPIWTRSDAKTTSTAIVLGALIIIAGLVNLATPRRNAVEWIEAVLGALLFISPWVLSYTGMYGMAWTAWIVGAVTVIVGIWGARFAEIHTHRLLHG